jgi:hypothetical protein
VWERPGASKACGMRLPGQGKGPKRVPCWFAFSAARPQPITGPSPATFNGRRM